MSAAGAPFNPGGLTPQRIRLLRRVLQLVNQALLFERVKPDRASQSRHLNPRPRQPAASSQVSAWARFRKVIQPGPLLQPQRIELLNLIDDPQREAGPLRDFLYRQLFFLELDNLSNRTPAVAYLPARGDELLEHQRGAGKRLEHQPVAALHALGDSHFLFPLQQWYAAHLAEISPHRIAVLIHEVCG